MSAVLLGPRIVAPYILASDENQERMMTQAGTKDHPITIEPIHERVRVIWHGRTIGDSKTALELREANYPPVVYVPRADMDMSALERTARVTTCPYKGEANYFSITDGKSRDDNAVWTYELPKTDVGEIGSHLAFYPDKVEITRGG
jgi:uncharacterized protein (DUF427 family)